MKIVSKQKTCLKTVTTIKFIDLNIEQIKDIIKTCLMVEIFKIFMTSNADFFKF